MYKCNDHTVPKSTGQNGTKRVIKSLVKVCLPESVGQSGMIHSVLAKCDRITCTFAYGHRSEWNNTLSSFHV